MKNFISAAILTTGLSFLGGAAPVAAPAPDKPPQAQSATHPWDKVQAVVTATEGDLMKGGLQTVRGHVADLEAALQDSGQAFEYKPAANEPIYVLVDGQVDALLAMAFVEVAQKKTGGPNRQIVAIPDPYTHASFYLGSYYNEIGRSGDALRVLDIGLGLPTAGRLLRAGEMLPLMTAERGAALLALRHWNEALADYDDGLTLKNLKSTQQALLQRGRGFALVELGRLDEGEKAYRDSLQSEPNNPRALNELTYIARLRAGGPAAPSGLFTQKPQPK